MYMSGNELYTQQRRRADRYQDDVIRMIDMLTCLSGSCRQASDDIDRHECTDFVIPGTLPGTVQTIGWRHRESRYLFEHGLELTVRTDAGYDRNCETEWTKLIDKAHVDAYVVSYAADAEDDVTKAVMIDMHKLRRSIRRLPSAVTGGIKNNESGRRSQFVAIKLMQIPECLIAVYVKDRGWIRPHT